MKRKAIIRPFGVAWAAGIVASAFVAACGWSPSRPFEREAPEVTEAIGHLDGGDAAAANDLLEEYLATGVCQEGSIGTPPRVKERSNGSFDLGLGLFRIAEAYGRRFGDEEYDAGVANPAAKEARNAQIECALKIVRAVAEDPTQAVDLRARARYLEGNLLFMNGAYEDAVRAYEKALELAPGMHDGGPISAADSGRAYTPDLVGRDAAWNRAIALRRIEDKKDAGKDANDDGGKGDSGNDDKNGDAGGNDDNKDAGKDSGHKDSGAPDSGGGDDDKKDKNKDSQNQPPPPPPPSRSNQDERVLDQLTEAPTVQQEAARKSAQKRHARGMTDK